MSVFKVDCGVLENGTTKKAVVVKIILKDGDIEFAMVIPPDSARTIAANLTKAADKACSKIITPDMDTTAKVGES